MQVALETRAIGTPGATGSSEVPIYGCWELNLGPLQDQQVLITTELSLALPGSFPLTYLAPGMNEWVDRQITV